MIDEKKLLDDLIYCEGLGRKSLEAVIELIKAQPKTDCSECSRRKFYQQGYQDGLNADKWIPCEERLPSDTAIHEVTAQFSNGTFYTEFAYYDESREEWWKFDDDGIVNVVAWKEGSEPYKKEGAENG